jgi:transcriptional regulator with XRE-family HTH domain/Zn-dependent peptidase ImmA (M78 family)
VTERYTKTLKNGKIIYITLILGGQFMIDKPNAFLNYLQTDRFYDRIKGSVFSWCINNKEYIVDKSDGSKVISYLKEIEEIDLDFINVWIDSKEFTKIEFDIAIRVDISFTAYSAKYKDTEQYGARLWVSVSCSGTMLKKLDDFYILGVDEYVKTKPKKPLSGNFVRYMKKIDYDKYADEILSRYYYPFHPELKIAPEAVDVEELANRMKLKIINKSISQDKDIFGLVFFDDASVDLFDNESNEYIKYDVSKNTMIIDSEAAYLRSFGSRNLTIAHECVHAYYHRLAFLFAKMINEDLEYIQCDVNGVMKSGEDISPSDWMEIQANGIAPYIVMPKTPFLNYAKELFEYYNIHGGLVTYTINQIVDKLAQKFEVTRYAARKRLIDLGFEEAIGSYNWVDEHYVRPYSFKKGSLGLNETYTISYKDIYSKVLSNSKLAMPFLTNQYVFVENHLCVNHPKYIEKNKQGDLILSDYALIHMNECCVKFKYNTIHGFNEGSDFGLFCYLSRDTSKELEYDLEIVNNPAASVNDPERFRVHSDSKNEVLSAIYRKSFSEILKYIMEFLDITRQELEIESGLSERTLRRYLNGENKVPDKRVIVALLRTLNLPTEISQIAYNQAGISFVPGDKEDEALLAVLSGFRGASVSDANRFLTSLGYEPLTKNN